MKSKHNIFFISLFCVAAIAAGLTYALKNIISLEVTPYWLLLIVFFVVVNVIIYFLSIRINKRQDISKATHFHMLTTVVKLIVYLVIMAVYAIMFPEDGKAFIITFMIYYLCFTFFETFVKIKINK